MQQSIELKEVGLHVQLRLPKKFDPSRAWPLRTEGEDTEALVLTATMELRERAIAYVKAHYPLTLTEGEKHQETTLSVETAGFRSAKGSVFYSLFASSEGFPSKGDKALVSGQGSIAEDKTARLLIPKLAPGVYALTLFHDENGNGKLDTKAFGMPKEGFGFSNNPKIRVGPPRFKDAAFAITGAGSERIVSVQLVHL